MAAGAFAQGLDEGAELVRIWAALREEPVIRESTLTLEARAIKPATLRLLHGLSPERCDESWLWPEQCAHCLGHTLPGDVPVQTV